MKKEVKIYKMLLVKPYIKNGEKKFSYTEIGVAFKKVGSNVVDLKLDLFPIMIPGAFIQLKPI